MPGENFQQYFGSGVGIQEEIEEFKKKKTALASAEISVNSMRSEEFMKEIGLETKVRSFEEAQKKLKDLLAASEAEKRGGFSAKDRFLATRAFYINQLGYSLRYRGFLMDKIEILDEKKEPLLDGKGKPVTFRAFYFGKTEEAANDFLAAKLKEKLKFKSENTVLHKQKTEDGFKRVLRDINNKQEEREQKISFLSNFKKIDNISLEKLANGLVRLAKLEDSGIYGLRDAATKNFIIKAGKELAVFGLSPFIAAEYAGRYMTDRLQTGKAVKATLLIQETARTPEEIPPQKMPDYYCDLLAALGAESKIARAELIRGYDRIQKKLAILDLIKDFKKENQILVQGRLNKLMGETEFSDELKEKVKKHQGKSGLVRLIRADMILDGLQIRACRAYLKDVSELLDALITEQV